MHKPILVTGASSGIGEASAVHLAHKGFMVFAAARRIKELNSLSALGDGRIHPITMDVTNRESISAAMSEIASVSSSPLYGLVNNAGVSVTGPIEHVSMDEWRRQFDTNVFGMVQVTQAVLPQMRAQGAGRIVNIGSIAGRIVTPFMGVYGSSKHAVEGLSDGLRREVAPMGIKVSLIRPGFINTHFGDQEQAGLEPHWAEDAPYRADIERFAKWHERQHPNAVAPSLVAECVYKAIISNRPHSRYTVPHKFLGFLAMRNLLPSAIVDRVLERTIGLDR